MNWNTNMKIICSTALFLLFIILNNCTESPIEENIDISNHTLRGKVELSDGLQPDGVFVWFKVLNMSTRTGDDGSFELNLPPASKQPGNGLDGIFNLYFYMSNYNCICLFFHEPCMGIRT